jgi:hypothetical protein
MLDGGVRLIAVARAQLLEDRCADLPEPELQNLGLNNLDDQSVINLYIVEVKTGST